ncbi:MAG: FAD:protein FMN transferase [Clostridia bacterium]|nr:FAD:protein FMN transferase [Clostridia bacterium]
MKKALFLLLLLFLTSCSPQRYSTQFFGYFDTVVSLDGFFESRKDFEKACEITESTLSEYHYIFDIHGGGELKSLNEKGSLEVSDALLEAIEFGIDAEKKTLGYCNIAMGSVLTLWHDARESAVPYLPDTNQLFRANEFTAIDEIEIDGNRVTLPENMTLDLGGIAKGFVSDILRERLEEEGFDNLIVNMGGNVIALGSKDGRGWKVGVKDPEKEGSLAESVSLADSSLVTSGNYERFFEYEGVRYHHIISPDTLFPSDRYLSVSVMYDESKWADVLSTALFSMELEDAYKILENFSDIGVMWIENDGNKIYYGRFCK